MTALDVGARIIASNGTTVVRDFHDHAGGVDVLSPITYPRFDPRRARTEWMHAEGDVAYGVVTRGTGVLVLNILVEAETWAGVETTWEAIEADLFAEPDYFVEVELEGVTRRYRTDIPSFGEATDVTPQDVKGTALAYQLRFIVQPNPTTTIEA